MSNIIQKVRLTYTVDVFIKGKNEDQIMDYIRQMTPREIYLAASKSGHYIEESFDEFVLADIKPDSEYDIDLTISNNAF